MLSEEILKETWDLTQTAYEDACEKVGYTNVELRSQVVEWEISEEDAFIKADALDEVYRELVCKLPSHVLQNIITANEEGKQRRGKKTIDTIATELLERELQ